MTDKQNTAFLITIDTEGDNAWAAPCAPSTRNAGYLPRFQALCEQNGLKPTYLTTWEMAHDQAFQDFASDALARGTAEVGMHLHPWHQPPYSVSLTTADWRHTPYLVEYPLKAMREKIKALTAHLEDTFETKMVSHRAGRWAFDERYAGVLIDEGYLVDCSVTPHVSWHMHPGIPDGSGGVDYRDFPELEYFLSLDNIALAGDSPLLELPMTTFSRAHEHSWRASLRPNSLALRVAERLRPSVVWLRPNGSNRRQLLWVLRQVRMENRPYAEFMLHSSELMPGGSPTFQTAASIERLYEDLEALFEEAADHFRGMTLATYRTTR